MCNNEKDLFTVCLIVRSYLFFKVRLIARSYLFSPVFLIVRTVLFFTVCSIFLLYLGWRWKPDSSSCFLLSWSSRSPSHVSGELFTAVVVVNSFLLLFYQEENVQNCNLKKFKYRIKIRNFFFTYLSFLYIYDLDLLFLLLFKEPGTFGHTVFSDRTK